MGRFVWKLNWIGGFNAIVLVRTLSYLYLHVLRSIYLTKSTHSQAVYTKCWMREYRCCGCCCCCWGRKSEIKRMTYPFRAMQTRTHIRRRTQKDTEKTTAYYSSIFSLNYCCHLYMIIFKWAQMNWDKTLNTLFLRRSAFWVPFLLVWINDTINALQNKWSKYAIQCDFFCVCMRACIPQLLVLLLLLLLNNLLPTCLLDHWVDKSTCIFIEWNHLKFFLCCVLFHSLLTYSPHKLRIHCYSSGMYLG